MFGLNQTIMYRIATLEIAALIGGDSLKRAFYIKKSDGGVGRGLIAGMAAAVIAVIADRMTGIWSRKPHAAAALGVETR